MNRPHTAATVAAFTVVELLIVIAIVAVLALLALPGLTQAKSKVRSVTCIGNLKQWGVALQMYASEHDDYFPDEGSPTPGAGKLKLGWYTTLPPIIGVRPYHEMPWRTNATVRLPRSVFICQANTRRATNNNLFHYCLNGQLDGTGNFDRPTKLSSLPSPSRSVYLFDNGKRAAVAQQNNVHTNVHSNGAQFLFVDGHAVHFRNTEFWDFKRNRGRLDHPDLIWRP